MVFMLLHELNDEQRQAAVSESKNILCLAGAGTGKTKTLVSRIAHLNDNRVGPSNMLALTFTRLAGAEMKERLEKLIGEEKTKELFCNTFHSFCVNVLREFGYKVGLDSNFMIYDQADRDSLIKTIIDEFCYRTTVNKVLDAIYSEVSETSEEVAVLKELHFRMNSNNAIDLDGLLEMVKQLFIHYSDVTEHYRKQYKYVFVDEYQDTSDTQKEIIQLLDPEHLFVVGDDFQAIYGWRGAEVENILNFDKEFENVETVKLTKNYRSTKPIIDAANRLIKFNVNQTDKELETSLEGVEVTIEHYENMREEADAIVEKIAQAKSFSDIAILARTNAQIEQMERALRENNIPTLVLSNKGDPLKDQDTQMLLGFMEIVINQKESWKIKRLVNYPETRLGILQLEEVELYRIERDCTYLEALQAKQKDYPKLQSFFNIINKLKSLNLYQMDAMTAFRAIVHTVGIIPMYQEKGLNNRVERLAMARDRIGRWIKQQERLGDKPSPENFLRWMVTRDIQEKLMDDRDAVRLMTVHGSKGLEFETVYIVGVNEDVFPSGRGDIEEERRLMYVAVTRAKRKLHISGNRFKTDFSHKRVALEESRFISELGC
jgi:DNA helicase II / ATP-dependent DNA helicase PcrA